VGVADGYGQGVGGVLLGDLRKFHERSHHLLDLFLAGPAVADHRAFDLQGSVLGYRQSGIDSGQEGDATGMAELEGGEGIFGDEDLFDGQGHGGVVLDDPAEFIVNGFEP
jgi:hypothetical protein